MLEFTKTLAETNGYSALSLGDDRPDIACYVGEEFKDILILTDCTRADLLSFFDDENGKVIFIMSLYDKVVASEFADSAKDIQLIACHDIGTLEQLESDIELKHKIMQLEENKYGMRISVLKYTDQGLARLSSEQDVTMAITSRVDTNISSSDSIVANDKTIDAALKEEPSFTALQLYAKLPFLSLRNFDAEMINEHISERFQRVIGQEGVLVERILALKGSTYTQQTTEEFILELEGKQQ